MVRIDGLTLKGNKRDQAAEIIAEIKEISAEEALEELDRAGKRRYILAKGLPEELAKEHAERFNAIRSKCAEFSKVRLG